MIQAAVIEEDLIDSEHVQIGLPMNDHEVARQFLDIKPHVVKLSPTLRDLK